MLVKKYHDSHCDDKEVYVIVLELVKELAYLNKGLTIKFKDCNNEKPEWEVFHDDRGLVGFIADLNENKEVTHDDIVYFIGEFEGQTFECAFQMTEEFNETIYSFCNNIHTIEGGTQTYKLISENAITSPKTSPLEKDET